MHRLPTCRSGVSFQNLLEVQNVATFPSHLVVTFPRSLLDLLKAILLYDMVVTYAMIIFILSFMSATYKKVETY